MTELSTRREQDLQRVIEAIDNKDLPNYGSDSEMNTNILSTNIRNSPVAAVMGVKIRHKESS